VAIYEHAEHLAGKTVEDYDPEKGIADPEHMHYRLRLSYDDAHRKSLAELLAAFLEDPAADKVSGIVFGAGDFEGGDSSAVVKALVAARDRLTNLKAIFLGDIIMEEQEISWINQSDVAPLFAAYPQLEHFRVRGANGLRLGKLLSARLQSLVIESGGLGADVVREAAAAELPALEHLELWLGTEEYGGNATVEDLKPILSGERLPMLRYLGLRDCAIADQVAAAVAESSILARLRVLDLSLGNLSDEGARALWMSPVFEPRRLAGQDPRYPGHDAPLFTLLEKLDIHHHYVSAEMVAKLKALGIEVDAGDPREADEDDGETYRYIAHAE
jgi:hypothetical protein